LRYLKDTGKDEYFMRSVTLQAKAADPISVEEQSLAEDSQDPGEVSVRIADAQRADSNLSKRLQVM
jgi:hypothetical protein